jgi:nitrate reductase delta subunit
MDERGKVYGQLAALFAYPRGAYVAELEVRTAAIAAAHGAAAESLQPLLELGRRSTLEEIQEIYTRTFDINPVCTLEVGWHIYGEDYARGAFLVKMREMLRENGIAESRELPDHLTHVLVILGRLQGIVADDLAARYLLPALDKMLDSMKDNESPYKVIVVAAAQMVRQDHDVEVISPRQHRGEPPGWGAPLPVYGNQGRGGAR